MIIPRDYEISEDEWVELELRGLDRLLPVIEGGEDL